MKTVSKTVRWRLDRAAAEFGIDRKTLANRLKAQGTDTGKDGAYSTRQICDAVFGDYESERIRKTRMEADILEVGRARVRNEVLETETVFRVWENIGLAIRRVVLTSKLSDSEKDAALSELREIKLGEYVEQRGLVATEDVEP